MRRGSVFTGNIIISKTKSRDTLEYTMDNVAPGELGDDSPFGGLGLLKSDVIAQRGKQNYLRHGG